MILSKNRQYFHGSPKQDVFDQSRGNLAIRMYQDGEVVVIQQERMNYDDNSTWEHDVHFDTRMFRKTLETMKAEEQGRLVSTDGKHTLLMCKIDKQNVELSVTENPDNKHIISGKILHPVIQFRMKIKRINIRQ